MGAFGGEGGCGLGEVVGECVDGFCGPAVFERGRSVWLLLRIIK